MANRARLEQLARQAARRYGVPEAGFLALIGRESGWDPSARSPVGAQGIAQFMPGTARGLGINPLDPAQALPAAAKHLATLKKNLGSWKLALAGYNAGAGAVQRYGGVPPYRETQNYVAALLPSFQSAPAPTATPTAPARPAPTVSPTGAAQVPDNGTINLAAVLAAFDKQAERALRGETPTDDYVGQVLGMVQQAKKRATPAALPGVGPLTRPRPGATQTVPGASYLGALAARPAEAVDFAAAPDYKWAQDLAKRFGLRVSSDYRSPGANAATGGSRTSRHMTRGAAADFAGSPENMRRLAEWAIRSGQYAEVFYDPLNVYWDTHGGRARTYRGGIGGHSDHVHISYGRPRR